MLVRGQLALESREGCACSTGLCLPQATVFTVKLERFGLAFCVSCSSRAVLSKEHKRIMFSDSVMVHLYNVVRLPMQEATQS